MQQNSVDFEELNIVYSSGSAEIMRQMQIVPAREPFEEAVVEFLNEVSKELLADQQAKQFPDVVTLAFWMRRASVMNIKKRFCVVKNNIIRVGRGTVFHIAPSNVPVNYAYSLVTGLLCGNKNIVRLPTKDFEQVNIINRALEKVLANRTEMRPYICLIRYGHDQAVTDAVSAVSDVRVIWGGDNTIREIRKSPMPPRATEITFADRYSLALIDADSYLEIENKEKTAKAFYNDTYLTDQNACTSPRAVVWMGKEKEQAKDIFWTMLQKIAEAEYEVSGVQAVSKLASGFLLAAAKEGVRKVPGKDNLIVRISVPELSGELMEWKDNSGFFFEYDCEDILELKEICDDTRCQTLAYIGNRELLRPLLTSGVKGIDRVVPVGRTMDFDFIWDGYNLLEQMTRNIVI